MFAHGVKNCELISSSQHVSLTLWQDSLDLIELTLCISIVVAVVAFSVTAVRRIEPC